MKIKEEHYEYIKNAIDTLIAKHGGDKWKDAVIKDYKSNGLSSKRCRWDFFHASTPNTSKWICENIYPYANDDHIDTVLRKVTGITY
jgi:hypothetical protein